MPWGASLLTSPVCRAYFVTICQIIRSHSASGVFSGYSRRRTRRNNGPSDKPAAGRPGVDRNLDNWPDGHRTDLPSLSHKVDEHPAAVALLDVPALERSELAPAQRAAPRRSVPKDSTARNDVI